MKRPIAKPSNEVMDYFTRDLYLRYNSADEDEADRAESEWEQACANYCAHLVRLRDHLPAATARLQELSLHDAEILAIDQAIEPSWAAWKDIAAAQPLWSAAATLLLRHDDQVFNLVYLLYDRLHWHAAPPRWPFSAEGRYWLYDELHQGRAPGLFLHRILLSDGAVLEIPGASVLFHTFPAELFERPTPSKRSA